LRWARGDIFLSWDFPLPLVRFEARVGDKNRVVVPKEVAEALGLREGDKLVLEVKSVIMMGTIEVRQV